MNPAQRATAASARPYPCKPQPNSRRPLQCPCRNQPHTAVPVTATSPSLRRRLRLLLTARWPVLRCGKRQLHRHGSEQRRHRRRDDVRYRSTLRLRRTVHITCTTHEASANMHYRRYQRHVPRLKFPSACTCIMICTCIMVSARSAKMMARCQTRRCHCWCCTTGHHAHTTRTTPLTN